MCQLCRHEQGGGERGSHRPSVLTSAGRCLARTFPSHHLAHIALLSREVVEADAGAVLLRADETADAIVRRDRWCAPCRAGRPGRVHVRSGEPSARSPSSTMAGRCGLEARVVRRSRLLRLTSRALADLLHVSYGFRGVAPARDGHARSLAPRARRRATPLRTSVPACPADRPYRRTTGPVPMSRRILSPATLLAASFPLRGVELKTPPISIPAARVERLARQRLKRSRPRLPIPGDRTEHVLLAFNDSTGLRGEVGRGAEGRRGFNNQPRYRGGRVRACRKLFLVDRDTSFLRRRPSHDPAERVRRSPRGSRANRRSM
jgi:hypothetical protein